MGSRIGDYMPKRCFHHNIARRKFGQQSYVRWSRLRKKSGHFLTDRAVSNQLRYNKPSLSQTFPTFALHVAIFLFDQLSFSLALVGVWTGSGTHSWPFSGCHGHRCSAICVHLAGNVAKQILDPGTAPVRRLPRQAAVVILAISSLLFVLWRL